MRVTPGGNLLYRRLVLDARHRQPEVLHHDGEQAGEALGKCHAEAVDVVDDGERPAHALAGNRVEHGGVVVRAETEGIDGHIADIDLGSVAASVLLAVGHEHDADDAAAAELAFGEDLEPGAEAVADVGGPNGLEAVDEPQQLRLRGLGDLAQWAEPGGGGGKGDDGEAVDGAELLDDELHGGLHLVELAIPHAAADIEHGHQVQAGAVAGGVAAGELQQHLLAVLLEWRSVVFLDHQLHSPGHDRRRPRPCIPAPLQ